MVSMALASEPGSFPAAQWAEIAENDAIHVTAANTYHRRPAGLAFQGDKPERLLHARMHEQVSRAVQPGELRVRSLQYGSQVTAPVFFCNAVTSLRCCPSPTTIR